MHEPLRNVVELATNDKEFIQAVRGCIVAYDITKKNPENPKSMLDIRLLDELQDRYKGLSFEVLVILFFETFHTDAFKNARKRKSNETDVMLQNQLVVIGMKICQHLNDNKLNNR